MDGKKKKAFDEIGIKIEEALERFSNMEDFYDRFISKFPEEKNFISFLEYMEAKDYKNAFFACHTLKGVVGNLSIMPLYRLISEETELLRNGTDVVGAAELLPQITNEFQRVSNIIHSYYQNGI